MTTSMKLTKTMREVAISARDHALRQEFDVWAGYWWTEYGDRIGSAAPMRLQGAGIISLGEPVRAFSGRSYRVASLTDLGRAAISGGTNG